MRSHQFSGRSIHSLVLALVAATAVACAGLPGFEPPATPTPCALAFSEARCDTIRVVVAQELGVEVDAVTHMEILPAPTPERRPDGGIVVVTTSGGPSPDIGVVLADGSTHVVTLHCGGVASGYVPACMDEPQLRAASMTLDGYRDIPCTGETQGTCATPHPPIQADAAADAQPIEVEAVDIPIDRVGRYEVQVGTGSVPNGILTEASFALVDAWPDGVIMVEGDVFLDVRSLEADGVPFHNYYEHGWREGVERVEAVLVFDVDDVEPGAVLRIRDVVVR